MNADGLGWLLVMMMERWISLEIGAGDLKSGFPVSLRQGKPGYLLAQGYLPATGELSSKLNSWRQDFEEWFLRPRAIKAKSKKRQNINLEVVREELIEEINDWLDSTSSPQWRKIRDALLAIENKAQIQQIVIKTENIHLLRLPWQVWDVFSHYFPHAELTVSVQQPDSVATVATVKKNKKKKFPKVKILAILGDDGGIDYQPDKQILQGLGNAEVEFLEKPSRQELIDKLWEQPWQVLFFAGHSKTNDDGSQGYFQLNRQEIISIADLKNSLKEAITNGLQLAIFNSCDGLGLAKQLSDLQLSDIVVMREKVPDRVAQQFLGYLLLGLARGDGRRSLGAIANSSKCDRQF